VFGATNANGLVEQGRTVTFNDESGRCVLSQGTNAFIGGLQMGINAFFTSDSKRLYGVRLWKKCLGQEKMRIINEIVKYLSDANGSELVALDEKVLNQTRTIQNGVRKRVNDIKVDNPAATNKSLCATIIEGESAAMMRRVGSWQYRSYHSKADVRLNITVSVHRDDHVSVQIESPDFKRLAALENEWSQHLPDEDIHEMSSDELLARFMAQYCHRRSLCDSVTAKAVQLGRKPTFDVRNCIGKELFPTTVVVKANPRP